MTNRLSTVRVELYNSYDDDVRFAFEVILSVWIYCMMLYTFYEILITQKKKGNMLRVRAAPSSSRFCLPQDCCAHADPLFAPCAYVRACACGVQWFSSGWNWVELISNGLLTACMCIWWVFVTSYSEVYDVALRYDVYANLQPTANYLALNQQVRCGAQTPGAGLRVGRRVRARGGGGGRVRPGLWWPTRCAGVRARAAYRAGPATDQRGG